MLMSPASPPHRFHRSQPALLLSETRLSTTLHRATRHSNRQPKTPRAGTLVQLGVLVEKETAMPTGEVMATPTVVETAMPTEEVMATLMAAVHLV